MTKYRIIEYASGRFRLQKKDSFDFFYRNLTSYSSLESAIDAREWCKRHEAEEDLDMKLSKKVVRIHE